MTTPHFAKALGKIPSGLFILTARHGKNETGMLASWVMQAGFEPPTVSIALRSDRYITGWLKSGTPLVLNLIGAEQKSFLSHFGKGFEEGEPAFEGLTLADRWREVAVLAGTAAHLECVAGHHVDSGDHRILLAEVVGGSAESELAPWVHLRSSGLRY